MIRAPRRLALAAAAALLASAGSVPARAGEVLVAVAANFAGPMARIAEGYTAATGHVVRISSGATGKFHAQIAAGAPFEVLLAADTQTPARLAAEGLAVAGSTYTYATGRLVLWSRDAGVVDAQGAVLDGDRLRHLAIANPQVAPYGAAALQVLRARGRLQALTPRLVTGESIAQAYQFVLTGNADAGFVALSQVQVPGKPVSGSAWVVPATLHAPLRQDAVLLKAGARNPAAAALLAYLKGDAAKALIRAHGYDSHDG